MKVLFRIVAALLFLVFFGFALKNTHEVTLRFFWGYEVLEPLALLLLAFFVAGASLGILAMLPTLIRHRRAVSQQKQQVVALERLQAQRDTRVQPAADGATPQ